MALSHLLTPEDPLGSENHYHLRNDDDAPLLLDGVPPFTRAFELGASVIIGRKGAGKTSVISGYRNIAISGKPYGRPLSHNQDREIIEIIDSQKFHTVVRSIATAAQARIAGINDPDFVFSDDIAELWDEAIWDIVFRAFFSHACSLRSIPDTLQPIIDLYNLENLTDYNLSPGSISRIAKSMIEAAKASLRLYLAQKMHGKKCYILFDSMEDYPARNELFSSAISGFLRAVNTFNRSNKQLRVVICLPEEVEKFVISRAILSSNLESDYSRAHRLRWQPRDLMRVVAHRYRLFIQCHQDNLYSRIKDYDFARREDLQKFYNLLFPEDVTNSVGKKENPLAYIIRHTQLQPRHVLLIFNRILSTAIQSGSYFELRPSYVTSGTSEVIGNIVEHVLYPYRIMYKTFVETCLDVLGDLPPVCSLGELDAVASRFKDRMEPDITNVVRTLHDIGIIGTVAEQQSQSIHGGSQRYVYGVFHYNSNEGFPKSNLRRYCLHPIFRRWTGATRRNNDEVVYPAHVGEANRTDMFFSGIEDR